MGDPGSGVDPTLENQTYIVDPAYFSDDDQTVAQVWLLADRIRALLGQTTHSSTDRAELAAAVGRQLRTAVLYRLIATLNKATGKGGLTVYALLFPGQARDNTGVKDLNDNVLGYTLHQQFIARRQEEIRRLFPPRFVVVGQDYKTALFLTQEQARADYDKRLRELDKALRQVLLTEFLPKSKKEGARKLQRVLEKDKNYRFDIYYGTDTLASGSPTSDVVLTVFILLTQALKGAAIARYISKGRSLRTSKAKKFRKSAKPDRKFDERGKGFTQSDFASVAGTAAAIKAFVTTPLGNQPDLIDYNSIYVDTVWTVAFLVRQSVANRDVIRDIRKGRLETPPRPNIKFVVGVQRELLELWVMLVNVIDFIKDFLVTEMSLEVRQQHDLAMRVLDELADPAKQIDIRQATEMLTRDLRQQEIAVLGATSEFTFFAVAADHAERIFFMMDVRDVGVETALLYDATTNRILDQRLSGRRLLEATVQATEPINHMQRFTYLFVTQVFGRYHALLKHSTAVRRTDGSLEAARAFRKASSQLGAFEDDVQILLGGDEVIVACHPRFAAYVHNIVEELAATFLGPGRGRVMATRWGVAFSQAGGPDRKQHQLAHDQAMRLADESHGLLKDLERRQRRMERLIQMLEDNPKKEQDAPKFQGQLDQLKLPRHFVRTSHGNPSTLPAKRLLPLIAALREGRVPTRDGRLVELVDFQGKVVDHQDLTRRADTLEETIRKKVGRDNVRVENPPMVKIPLPKPGKDEDDDT
ncbi:MAG: hypothetical protein ACRCYU_10255 [Nocardioides sp.]